MPLSADEDTVKEPENASFKNPHAPTVEKKDAKHVPKKFSFLKYLFDIPPFTAITKIIARYSNGTPKKEKDGSNKSEDVVRMWGHVNPEIVKK